MSVLTRREAREKVIELLFETEFRTDEDVKEVFAVSVENREIPENDYVAKAYFGVQENKEQIDAIIGECSIGWKTDRLTRLSRSVLRLAVYEMMFIDDVPSSVAINEAIELTKRFDDPKAKAFVNGVLNAVKDKLEEENK